MQTRIKTFIADSIKEAFICLVFLCSPAERGRSSSSSSAGFSGSSASSGTFHTDSAGAAASEHRSTLNNLQMGNRSTSTERRLSNLRQNRAELLFEKILSNNMDFKT
jgi:hypothetical protein